MRELELKAKLRSSKESNFATTRNEALTLMPAMLEAIGSVDGELRDDLIYAAFVQWIYVQRLVPAQDMRAILALMLDDHHMFYQIGEVPEDGVFTRAFSVLVLPLLLAVHRSTAYLSAVELQQVKVALIRFFDEERDKRGFVQEKGWAHAIAHAADALDDLALCGEMQATDLQEMLMVTQKVICDPAQVYIHSEEERLGRVVISVISRNMLGIGQVNDWIATFQELVLAEKRVPQSMYLRSNVRNFLCSLYFRLHWKNWLQPYGNALNQTLRAISRFAE